MTQAAWSQTLERVVTGIPVEQNGRALEFPFLGGLDIFLPQFVDADGDGDLDLFIAEPEEQYWRLSYFENLGTPQAPRFRLIPGAYDALRLGNWYYLIDIDADGDPDMYCGNSAQGLAFYRNLSPRSQPQFVLETNPVLAIDGEQVSSEFTSIPAFADIDADGDFDFFTGISIGTIAFYRNGGGPTEPSFAFETSEWEDLLIFSIGAATNATFPAQEVVAFEREKNFAARTFPLIVEAAENFAQLSFPQQRESIVLQNLEARHDGAKPNSDGHGNQSASNQSTNAHGASGIEFVDLDGDGDQDFFYGDLFHKSVYRLRNDGTPQDPQVAITDTLFPVPQPVTTQGYNIPRFADIDADGDPDFFVACIRQTRNNFLLYRNHGSSAAPQLALATADFLSMLEAGSNSVPALADINADGDLDLFIGNLDGQLIYFENIGTAAAPAFRWITDSFQNIRLDLFFSSAPAFVDIDADGDLDLFLGSFSGRLAYFENRGSRQQPNYISITTSYQNIDVGNASAPFFADIDRDGDFDLFIGESNRGLINIFENTGTPQQPNFSLRKEFQHTGIVDDAIPCLYDWNGDGILDLFVGQRNGKILHYRGVAPPDSFALVAEEFDGIDVGVYSAPLFADLNGDGRIDLLVGEQAGGVNLFLGSGGSSVAETQRLPASFELSVYPNPFHSRVEILVRAQSNSFSAAPQAVIYNLLGARVAETSLKTAGQGLWKVQWLASDLDISSGVYILQVNWGRAQITRKLALVR